MLLAASGKCDPALPVVDVLDPELVRVMEEAKRLGLKFRTEEGGCQLTRWQRPHGLEIDSERTGTEREDSHFFCIPDSEDECEEVFVLD